MNNQEYKIIAPIIAGAASLVFCLGIYVGGLNKANSDAIKTIKNAQTTIYDKANNAPPNLSIEVRKEFLELGDHLGDAAKLLQGEELSEIIEDEARRIEVQRMNEEAK